MTRTYQTRQQAHDIEVAAGRKGIEVIKADTVVGRNQDGSPRLPAPADVNDADVRVVDGDKVGPWAKSSAEADAQFDAQEG